MNDNPFSFPGLSGGSPSETTGSSGFLDPHDFPQLRQSSSQQTPHLQPPAAPFLSNNPLPMSMVVSNSNNGVQKEGEAFEDNFPALQTRTGQNLYLARPPQPTEHDLSLAGEFGLMGLMSVIRMDDPTKVQLALGIELTSLGLDLNSEECLYNSFNGPWKRNVQDGADKPLLYSLPDYYPQTSLPVRPELFPKLTLDCLFASFYSVIRDVIQVLAASELTRRKWYYHVELKIWFSASQHSILYFDLDAWECKIYSGTRFQDGFVVKNGFLAEDVILNASRLALAAMATTTKPANFNAWS